MVPKLLASWCMECIHWYLWLKKFYCCPEESASFPTFHISGKNNKKPVTRFFTETIGIFYVFASRLGKESESGPLGTEVLGRPWGDNGTVEIKNYKKSS